MRLNRIVSGLCSLMIVLGVLVSGSNESVHADKRLLFASRATDSFLLIIPSQVDPKKPRKDDPTPYVRDYVRETLREAGKYEVITFSEGDAKVKRGITDRVLATKDLDQPYSNETLQKFASIFGANRVLYVVITETKKGLRANVLLLGSVGQQTWQTLLSDELSTGDVLGTQRFAAGDKKVSLKIGKKDLNALISDDIIVHLGLPSQLNERMPSLTALRLAQDVANSSKAEPKDPKKPAPTENSGVKPTAQEGTKEPTTPKPSGLNPVGNDTPTKAVKPPPDKITAIKPTPTPSLQNRIPGDITTATDAVSLPLNVQRTDSEEQLRHYRQEKDLANVILSLRRALNEHPHELVLREQLVQAYQDRGQWGMAKSEVERAMTFQPESTILRRLYGNILFNQGDVPNALKSYREAIRLDPKNVLAQIAMGDALLADNQFKEAFDVYETAIKNSPESPIPYRRLARALLSRADSDPKNYDVSVDNLLKAKSKTPPTETEGYTEDYIAIMRLMESRIRDMISELQNGLVAYRQGKIKVADLNRALSDMKERAKYAEDYLDKLPPAIGHDPTQAKYQQAMAFLSQAVSLFRAYLQDNDSMTETTLRTTLVNASRELTAAGLRLTATKTALPTNNAPVNP